MPAPINTFKQALKSGDTLIGFWLGLTSPAVAEMAGRAGYDWLLIDNEHGPNDLQSTLVQMQAIAATGASSMVRVPQAEAWMIKQMLDAGAQTLLVPMIDTPEQAAAMVRAMRYPPEGIRGVGAALGRASYWNTIPDYLTTANDQMCLIVQAETSLAISNLPAILATEGVDGVFIGPADLSADMGLLGQLDHPDVIKIIEDSIRMIRAAGKSAGIIWGADDAQRWIDCGANFVAIGADAPALASAMTSMRKRFA
ncbi:MAG: 4-hydroxy-2-oxoheptanedioate aldolase [Paracoccaceae bacterium]|jgi:4-hydroxy-2-oxoheptanedioate aldolase